VSRIKRLACEALAVKLAASHATLTSRVSVLQQAPDKVADYPAVVVMPMGRFKVIGLQDDEALDADGDPIMGDDTRALMHVGEIRGSVRIWLASRTPAQREVLEDAILSVFTDDGMAAGRCLATLADLTVGGIATGYDTPIAFLVDSLEFHEEMVFSEKRWVFTEVDVDLPILALRRSAALVEQLVLALTSDLETDVSEPGDLATLANLEQHTVAADGVLGTYP
jgi:hypothetical protein